MEILIEDLNGIETVVNFEDVSAVYRDDDVVYFSGVPYYLSTARPNTASRPTAPTPPLDADPLHIGNIGLADIQDELPELTIPQIQALLDEYREDIEEQLGAECRRLLREFAAEMDWKRRYVYLS